ncbi:MAG: hypothetical protein OdinLCB4_006780 [Candidatus Odinarchaeum yellowstonii]|uniref:LexA repressor DNA-binding domain-containing protein n=1 Tax=Odinarchaeota yellowstonii (strain LCB_4) TaxID=1841599 RepID=A0AAF0D1W3_ODILC|nr:MAG: hypothetical protein OdinLCB4_006780 [Candidatus Odinarchaeum yellowstonii]
MPIFRGKKIYDLLFYIYFKTMYESKEPSISELGRRAGYSTPSGGPKLSIDKLKYEGLIEEKQGKIFITSQGKKLLEKFLIPFDFIKTAAFGFTIIGAFLIIVSLLAWVGFLFISYYLYITGGFILACGIIFYFTPKIYYWNLKKNQETINS